MKLKKAPAIVSRVKKRGGRLAMSLIFQENPGLRAYKLVAYKKSVSIV